MDMTFLEEDVETWEDIDSFQSSRSKVHGINVVNDPAERTVKLTTEFLSSVLRVAEVERLDVCI